MLEKFTLAPREFTSASDELGDDDEVNLTLLRENGQVKVMVMYSSEIQALFKKLLWMLLYLSLS